MGTLTKSARRIHDATKGGKSTPMKPLSTTSRGNGASQQAATKPNIKKNLKGPF